MFLSESPCLSLAIAHLTAAEANHYAVWVLKAPYPGGYVLHDRIWSHTLTQLWLNWQHMFSMQKLTEFPQMSLAEVLPPPSDSVQPPHAASEMGLTVRLMQHMGVTLWQWLFDGPIQNSLAQSQGIAIGQGRPLRLRLEIRDPNLVPLPWEIMQSQPGTQAIALNHQQILFSRTTTALNPLPDLRQEHALKVLLVLGQDTQADICTGLPNSQGSPTLKLQDEAVTLEQILRTSVEMNGASPITAQVPCEVTTLQQPTVEELINHLETLNYNILFYSGHGIPSADGGLLFLRADATLNGVELAQVLVSCQVKLAVFNACWGAQPEHENGQPIARSSLAEVLICHGVPAVLGMRDTIADPEAIRFIQVFARSLAERLPIDQAVAIARQHLLTLYKFNQATWTLPVLYMHPDFDGELIKPVFEGVTEIPDNSPSWLGQHIPSAYLRALSAPAQIWRIHGGMMRIGFREDNDLVLPVQGVSRQHAEIFYRDSMSDSDETAGYILKDFSRFGTFMMGSNGWFRVNNREVPLKSGTRLRFGNVLIEFVVNE